MESEKEIAAEREKAIKCLRQLRDLLTDDLDLKSPIHDERFLLRFVRHKKYDASQAYESVRKYFRMRRKFPKIFNNAFPSYEPAKALLEANVVCKSKYDDPEGRIIIIMNTLPWDVTKCNLDHLLIAMYLVLEELSPVAQLKGIVILYDKDGFSVAHAKEYTISRLKAAVNVVQGSVPVRVNGFNIIKEPKIMDVVMAAIRPFLKEKFKERMILHGYELDGLINKFGADKLPKHFGGTLTEEESYDFKFRDQLFKNDMYYKGLLEYGLGEGCSDDEDTYM